MSASVPRTTIQRMIRVSGRGFFPSRVGGGGLVAGAGVLGLVGRLMGEQCHVAAQLGTSELCDCGCKRREEVGRQAVTESPNESDRTITVVAHVGRWA